MITRPITRRTAVTGAAWGVPAVAVATAAPAHASSVTFSFESPSYPGCGAITNVVLSTSTSLAGQTITLTLPSTGFTFTESRTKTTTVTASASGSTACPSITLDPGWSTGELTATVTGHQASTQVLAGGYRAVIEDWSSSGHFMTSGNDSWTEITPLGGGMHLEGTTLYHFARPTTARDVAQAYGYTQPDGRSAAAYIGSSGAAYTYTVIGPNTGPVLGSPEAHPAVPSNATPLGASFFLAGSDLYLRNSRVASDVAAAHGYFRLTDGAALATVIRTNGTAGLINTSTYIITLRASVPLNATPLAGDYYLAGTDLYYGNTRIAQNIRTAVAYCNFEGTEFHVDCTTTNGAAILATPRGITTTHTYVPLHSTPIGGGLFLAGDVLYRDSEQNFPGVLRAHAGTETKNQNGGRPHQTVTYVERMC